MYTLDWISHRASITFPLQDTMTGQATNMNVSLPRFLLLDINIIIPPTQEYDTQSNYMYISKIVKSLNTISIYIGIQGSDSQVIVFHGIDPNLGLSQLNTYRYYTAETIIKDSKNWKSQIEGNISIGASKDFKYDLLVFQPSRTRINRACITKYNPLQLDIVQAIVINQKRCTGIVQINTGQGIKVQIQQNAILDSGDTGTLISLSVTQKQGQNTQYTYIKSINGVTPDSEGNINIIGMDCVKVQSIDNAGIGAISVSNTCAKPCCTVEDQSIKNMKQNIQSLQQAHQILKNYFVSQSNNINILQTNLSKLLTES